MIVAALLRSRSANLPPGLLVRLSRVPGHRSEAAAMAKQLDRSDRDTTLLRIALGSPVDDELVMVALRLLEAYDHGYSDKAIEVLLELIGE